MDKATLTEGEFCAAVGISRVTAWRLRRQGKLPHCKIGVKILYRPEHVARFLEAHEQQPQPVGVLAKVRGPLTR